MVRVVIALVLLLAATVVAAAHEDPPAPLPRTPTGPGAPRPVSAEERYEDGLALARQQRWSGAETAYREALQLRPAFPEAWNGLGFALRQQGRYADSVRAYQEALRLRPNYPQALEYLGEAYVRLGRLADARAILIRLQPLDSEEATELAQAIQQASSGR
jgi:Flp pilus assembly protein TadD